MPNVIAHSLFTEFDINLFKAGKHYRLYEKFGSHPLNLNGVNGTYFAVWAPSAKQVSVIGDFNHWVDGEFKLKVRWDASGIWEGFIPYVGKGNLYKYKIHSTINNYISEKADPYAKRSEHPPKTASAIWIDNYQWNDKSWLDIRKNYNALDAPFSVYEVHLGSWKRKLEENRFLSYFELADELVSYVKAMNFTHVEFMPIMEFPYDPSWGYQITGYFAPTSRFGYPDEFKYLVDKLHQNNIGLLLDWVPSHFPEDAHGLGFFDGSHLYEHPDRKRGYHLDWKSLIFNYGRHEVRSFLISNALFWLDHYHADGLRVDAVASMLFLDYSRNEGEWEANIYGGNENLEAISFLKELNTEIYKSFPDVQSIAEESTAFPKVSSPVFLGGLGFGMKWMMGWMHDTLQYFSKDPIYRRFHQNDITFSLTYAFTENYMLPLSHDEVVYGKNSILGKMPGDEWQRFANLRLLYGYMFTHPGTKLLFMGGEFGQYQEWNFEKSLDWNLLDFEPHKNTQNYVAALNQFYKTTPALFEKGFSSDGFEWLNYEDATNSVIAFIRKGVKTENRVVVICNFTPNTLLNYRLGMPQKGKLKELFNSDAKEFGGSGLCNTKQINIKKIPWNGRNHSAEINLPPLGIIILNLQ
ncbi:MAG: 1,4-alpha-glucan branching enzyme [Flavobacteriales bacterium CG_4_9_14_0_2_um_filter_35_242]|nr:1,4-alpha-glucan branching protein GlgB [Zetaproteobacteria bacterium]NDK17516.1 1,4-alpha-glucan branching protein GlgB [Flavobacteriales bacterium]OIO09284.1 MAG: 1,4-alpha-glucan branching enzyme [Flavobacteriaceae bacterium CG1_02_35_72]PIX06928.1 MAG: 1,4-alpha-glucan branching enzyme [Flavobacteriales bacterium CG_4_8_14_3_um_filter_35_10]PJA05570.1 MAG: 1,4-alpha-glucan branching enzyme [Flavobacteriales bacterium CG_4_10_14_0_2_um_filter_35_18]PJC60368.1 MAG: 1,4-alpha-glucan branch